MLQGTARNYIEGQHRGLNRYFEDDLEYKGLYRGVKKPDVADNPIHSSEAPSRSIRENELEASDSRRQRALLGRGKQTAKISREHAYRSRKRSQ